MEIIELDLDNENEMTFKVQIEGTTPGEPICRLMIETNDINHAITGQFLDNDEALGPFSLGFEFPFYNTNYSNFIINPNGWIGFTGDNSECENIEIPSSDAPLASIMAFWDDLNPINSNSSDGMAGQVSFYTDSSKLRTAKRLKERIKTQDSEINTLRQEVNEMKDILLQINERMKWQEQ